ncbi:MAG: hypothetical protein GY696_26555, partial [Gammaproteobacteria bacterium]|nr:hypothetical protein [Gammaproteobacteria bacterium]
MRIDQIDDFEGVMRMLRGLTCTQRIAHESPPVAIALWIGHGCSGKKIIQQLTAKGRANLPFEEAISTTDPWFISNLFLTNGVVGDSAVLYRVMPMRLVSHPQSAGDLLVEQNTIAFIFQSLLQRNCYFITYEPRRQLDVLQKAYNVLLDDFMFDIRKLNETLRRTQNPVSAVRERHNTPIQPATGSYTAVMKVLGWRRTDLVNHHMTRPLDNASSEIRKIAFTTISWAIGMNESLQNLALANLERTLVETHGLPFVPRNDVTKFRMIVGLGDDHNFQGACNFANQLLHHNLLGQGLFEFPAKWEKRTFAQKLFPPEGFTNELQDECAKYDNCEVPSLNVQNDTPSTSVDSVQGRGGSVLAIAHLKKRSERTDSVSSSSSAFSSGTERVSKRKLEKNSWSDVPTNSKTRRMDLIEFDDEAPRNVFNVFYPAHDPSPHLQTSCLETNNLMDLPPDNNLDSEQTPETLDETPDDRSNSEQPPERVAEIPDDDLNAEEVPEQEKADEMNMPSESIAQANDDQTNVGVPNTTQGNSGDESQDQTSGASPASQLLSPVTPAGQIIPSSPMTTVPVSSPTIQISTTPPTPSVQSTTTTQASVTGSDTTTSSDLA